LESSVLILLGLMWIHFALVDSAMHVPRNVCACLFGGCFYMGAPFCRVSPPFRIDLRESLRHVPRSFFFRLPSPRFLDPWRAAFSPPSPLLAAILVPCGVAPGSCTCLHTGLFDRVLSIWPFFFVACSLSLPLHR